MTVLRKYAEQLASKPPVALYEQLMKLITDEQITSLQESLKGLEKLPLQKAQVESSIESCRTAAQQYRNNVTQYSKEIADFSVGAICDLAAMCTMMIAAGTERVEHLKQQLLGKTKACSYERGNGDRAYIFLRSEGNKFKRELNDWTSQEGKSVVQFKFPANGDLHTFAAEKFTHELGVEPYFYMYQAFLPSRTRPT